MFFKKEKENSSFLIGVDGRTRTRNPVRLMGNPIIEIRWARKNRNYVRNSCNEELVVKCKQNILFLKQTDFYKIRSITIRHKTIKFHDFNLFLKVK